MKDFDDTLNELRVIDVSIDAFYADMTVPLKCFFELIEEYLVCRWIEEWFIGRIECRETLGW